VKIFDVAIIGGGPAGTAAAIDLAGAGHSVILLEARPVPHDKLCGEFLSSECQALLARLGLSQTLRGLHATTIRDASIIAGDGTRWTTALIPAGWGLSRAQLDFALIEESSRRGAQVLDMRVCIGVSGNLEQGFDVMARNTQSEAQEKYMARVVLSAHGKRSTMDRLLQRRFLGKRYPLFGMKRHFRGPLPDGVSLHAFAGGYCGLAPVEDGAINLCFLADERIFRAISAQRATRPMRQHVSALANSARAPAASAATESRVETYLAHIVHANPNLESWLLHAEPVGERWLSVGALVFGARGCVSHDVLLAGDAAGMIAPLAGDGIAMALHSGRMCAREIEQYLQGECSAGELKARYTRAWQSEFLPRIRLAGALQAIALRPSWLRPALKIFQRIPTLGHWAVRYTRGR